ncbi:MAG TPA: hypothetical protein VF885_19970 [Arthrobacter sp.]
MTKAVKAPSAGARKTRAAKAPAAKSRAPKAGVKKPAARKPAASSAKAPKRPAGTTATTRTPRPAASRTRRPAAAKAPARRTSRAPKPKAMEVLYSGKVFRSRLEARWAVFLDLLGVNWDYEPCHYEIGPDLYYLPDFYLPDHQMWLEVKGAPFMDAASYAKILGAVAGPHRIPLREFPYTPSERLLLGGPFRELRHGLVPVHTLVTPAGPRMAHLTHAVFGLGADGAAVLTPSGPAWDTVPATGAKASRRPTPERLGLLLEPEPQLGPGPDGRVARAYDAAYRLTFNEATKRVSDNAAGTLLGSLAHRRSGRPLGLGRAA